MENLVWGARDSQGKVTSMKLHLGDPEGQVIATFVYDVRHVIVEMEPDAQLTPVEAAFVAWIARLTLEEKLVSTTWVLTMTLAAMTPFIIWYFFI